MAWRFEHDEALPDAFARVAREEVAKVRGALASPDVDRNLAIHEARQSFKRLRALIRLAKPTLGCAFEVENRRWRDAGHLLSTARDRTVLLETFDDLAAKGDAKVLRRNATALRGRLARSTTANGTLDWEANVDSVVRHMDDAEAAIGGLDWPKGKYALRTGLKKSQARLRRSWKEARKDTASTALHRWRKRVKDQSAQLRLFRGAVHGGLRSRLDAEKGVAELLGKDHDLWLLHDRLSGLVVSPQIAKTRDLFLQAIDARRKAFRDDAFGQGKAFSSKSARALADEIANAWAKASVAKSRHRGGDKAGRRKSLAAISPVR